MKITVDTDKVLAMHENFGGLDPAPGRELVKTGIDEETMCPTFTANGYKPVKVPVEAIEYLVNSTALKIITDLACTRAKVESLGHGEWMMDYGQGEKRTGPWEEVVQRFWSSRINQHIIAVSGHRDLVDWARDHYPYMQLEREDKPVDWVLVVDVTDNGKPYYYTGVFMRAGGPPELWMPDNTNEYVDAVKLRHKSEAAALADRLNSLDESPFKYHVEDHRQPQL